MIGITACNSTRALARRIFMGVISVWFMTIQSVMAATPVQVVTSDKGLTAWLVEDHTNPMMVMSFMFRNGASSDPEEKSGLSTLLSGMLDEGAGPYDSQAFQKLLEDHNIGMSFSAGRDTFSGTMRTLTSERDKAFSLLKLAITEPKFDPEPLERMRDVYIAMLHQREERPVARVADTMLATLFEGHPYARLTAGTLKGLTAITKADLQNYVKTRFAKEDLIISVVGDITPEALKTALDNVFSDLPEQTGLPKVTDIRPRLDGAIHPQSMPIPQATALFVQNGPSRNSPDWHAYQVVMYVLGDGGFSSRLLEEVREKRGLAYSVNASANPLLHAPLTLGTVGTQNARIGESLDIIHKEWERMRISGPTDTEIRKAKDYLIGSLPLRFNASKTIANSLTALQLFKLPPDDLDKRAEVIENLKAEDIRNTAKRWLKPDALTTFVVGDLKKMPKAIQDAK